MTINSPSADISKSRSGCWEQNSANSSSVIGCAVRIAGRNDSSMVNAMIRAERLAAGLEAVREAHEAGHNSRVATSASVSVSEYLSTRAGAGVYEAATHLH